MDSGEDSEQEVSAHRARARALRSAYMAKREDLIRYFAARLRSREAAEDLIQDLYVRVSALNVDEDIENPSAYLYRLASNLMLDRLRSEQRSGARDDAWRQTHRTVFAGQDVVDEASPEQAAEARERLARTIKAIKELPPRTRRAFELHRLDGLSQEETARSLGVSRKTIEKQISSALRILVKKVGAAER